MTTPTGAGGGASGGLPGLTGIAGGSSSSGTQYLSSMYGAAPGPTSTFQSKTAQPNDSIFVGYQALGVTAPSGGHDTGRFSASTTYDQAQNLPSQWYANNPGFYKQFVAKAIMFKLPGASADMGLPEAGAVWDNLLQTAIQLNKANPKGKNWTPWDVLDSYNRPAGSLGTRKVGDWLIDNATGDKVKYVGPKSKTTSQTAIDLSNPEQVQAIATQTLTQMIGRAPTDKELATFKATLNGYERGHPELTTTTENYDDMGNVSATNVVHSGGVTDAARQTVLGKGVQKTKEYGKYQAGTTYFNALLQMLGGG